MNQYTVMGMSCAACQARVEKAVSKVQGAESVAVNLLTNSMGVKGTASPQDIILAVEKAGYKAKLNTTHKSNEKNFIAQKNSEPNLAPLQDSETPKLKKRLKISIVFLIVLMYITMGHNMLDFPLPKFFEHNHLALTLTQLLLSSIVMIVNGKFFTSGFKALFLKSPNMDSLVALGSSVSYAWSIFVFYKMCGMITQGVSNMNLMELYHNELYFESAAMIPALITIGKLLESISKGRTTNALKSLIKLAPKTAKVIKNDKELETPIDNVQVNDIFVVYPGESIPVDGIVIEGISAVNESALTGESIPVDKSKNSKVNAATINISGFLKCRATRVGLDTTFSQIIQTITEATATKAPIARIADKVSGIFVPIVIAISIVAILGWLLSGESISFALARGISILVISCPCALGLATPVAIMVGSGIGAKNGILFKTSEAIENASKIKTIILDKTGTITTGNPIVTDIKTAENVDEKELLEIAFSLEKKSEHPLAKAIVQYAKEKNITLPEIQNFKIHPGNGVSGLLNEKSIHGGNEKYITQFTQIHNNVIEQISKLTQSGKTPIYFERDSKLLGIIAVADSIKKDSAEAIKELKKQGLVVAMLTGDNEATAKSIGHQVGIDNIFAEVLPQQKETTILEFQKSGRVCMVGDGINDALALTRADVGIAIGSGTDVAIDSADIVLINSSLNDVVTAIKLSKATLKNIKENLFWAFFYNALCIPLAAGLLGYKMNPMLGALAMSISSFTVCINALRLNFFKPSKKSKIITDIKKDETMERIIKVKGMMCAHCESTVKKALETLPFIAKATPNYKKKNVSIELSGEFDEDIVKRIIYEKGYKYLGM